MKRKNINDLDFRDILNEDYFNNFLKINYDLVFLNDIFKRVCKCDLEKFKNQMKILIEDDMEYLNHIGR